LLNDIVEDNLDASCRPPDGPYVWPLHGPKVVNKVSLVQTMTLMGRGSSDADINPCWKRVLVYLRIIRADKDESFVKLLQDVYGPSTAYMFARSRFFAQMLWLLSLWAIPVALLANPAEGGGHRIAWEVSKALVIVWGIVVVLRGQSLTSVLVEKSEAMQLKCIIEEMTVRNPKHQPGLAKSTKWMKMAIMGIPLVFLFVFLVIGALFMFTELIIHLTYIWGDCVNIRCNDPSVKHDFVGFLAEVGTDIAMAIIFELFFAVGHVLSSWISDLRNHALMQDCRFTMEMLSIFLSSIERIGTFGIIAFVFVPQWEEPRADDWNPDVDCSDLVFGESSMLCMQRRLPLKSRRLIFQKAFKGPFVVAPFVGIIVKVLIPFVANYLDRLANYIHCCCACCNCCMDGIPHILGLIFYYDGGAIGCFKYVLKGWPFRSVAAEDPRAAGRGVPAEERNLRKGENIAAVVSDEAPLPPGSLPEGEATKLEVISSSDADGEKGENAQAIPAVVETAPVEEEEDEHEDFLPGRLDEHEHLIDYALRQGVKKQWEPMEELLEVKLTFLWILFFAPVMPLGVIPTLFAKVLECHTDLMKMLFVRQRTFPEPNVLMHFTQTTFNRAAVCAAVGWSVGLSVLTYNDDLWKWNDISKQVVMGLILLWMFLSGLLMLRRSGSR